MFCLCHRFLLRLDISLLGCLCFSVYNCVVPFIPHLLQFVSNAGHLCNGVQCGAPRNLHALFPVGLIFGLAPNFCILCIGSPLIVCLSFDENNAFGIVFFLFLFSHVFCLIDSIVIFKPRDFSFITLSRNFLSVIAVIYLDISSSSTEIALKLHSFSISISLLQNSPKSLLPLVSPKRNLRGCDKCCVLVSSTLGITGLDL